MINGKSIGSKKDSLPSEKQISDRKSNNKNSYNDNIVDIFCCNNSVTPTVIKCIDCASSN